MAGGILGGIFGGGAGFVGSVLSQVTDGGKIDWRKAAGSAANGAVVGAAKGALVGSGVGVLGTFAIDFTAGSIGDALEQGISTGRVELGRSLLGGAENALSEMLYGTGELKGVGDAFRRGAKTGAVMSGLKNLTDAFGGYGLAGDRIFGRKPKKSIITGSTGRDPKRMCGSPDPFDLADGLGNGRGYHSGRGHGGAGHSRTGEESRFSLGGLLKDMVTGGIVGGLGSAGFYGAGKAVDALRESFVGRKNSRVFLDDSNMMYRKTKDASYIEPMPKRQLQRIVKSFKKQGGVIQMNDATDVYLALRNAEGITLNENTILLRNKPGRASVFEELIHATQFRQGLNDGSVTSRINNEIAAQKILLRNSEAYKLTSAEIKQTKLALASYVAELQKLTGGN